MKTKKHNGLHKLKTACRTARTWFKQHRFIKWFGLVLGGLLSTFLIWLSSIYAFSLYYNHQHRDEPFSYGVTFIANYARYLELEPRQTFLALRDELGFRRFRLVSYWSDIEKTKGRYDFRELDWQLRQVEQVNGEVSLAIGLRQPRWPECHLPKWLEDQPKEVWYPELQRHLKAVVSRYKDRPVITSYQLENEHMLSVFGDCTDFSRQRLQEEYDLVKSMDPQRPIILSLANNYFGVPTGQPRPDQFGISVYKRVFDSNVTNNYFEYPFPAWYYGGRAGMTEALTGKSSMLHELQAEPWPPIGMKQASIAEQDKSMDAKRLKERFAYARGTGFKTIDLWGAEWWYWRKLKFNDPSLWRVVKQELNRRD